MLQFVDLKQETPVKRDTSKRKSDFKESYWVTVSGGGPSPK